MAELEWRSLAAAVRARRNERGWTQLDVAARGGPSIDRIQAIEGVRTDRYSPRILAKLERALEWEPGSCQAVLDGGEATPADLARSLAETTANLDAYIERRAQEIAAPRIAAVEQETREQIAELNKKAIAARQRASDLEAELRRQLDAQVRRAERAEARVNTS